ncbi:putative cinnamoyl-CoA reductase [Talaromyces proteolyticus]|uniref:Cinnamoyl-CoA reductase n=1 Tax=Talaromyces proteolyticus TaxID=1131652 RepID=A0AAD4KIX1_9EURO|nr:putative cinnamoyl-CoA reductase [Talaromyces proteolyticus]KAH8689555.1 putative cinnamoyl-CoA reductase [Talaromyces proteolyticus]
MPPQHLVLPSGSWILVTGANGYIGSQIVNSFLALGYRVRGTVRTPKPWLDSYFTEKYGDGKFESVVVPMLDAEDAFKGPMQGISGVVHVATEVSFNPDPQHVIPQMKVAMENILNTAAAEESVRRVVFTSSAGAVLIPRPNEEIIVDVDTWNDFAVQGAWDPNSPEDFRGALVYCASKVEAERTAWKFMEEKKPNFTFNSVIPNVNFGRILHPEIRGSSMGGVRELLKGEARVAKLLIAQWFVDVEDTAKIHTIALLDPEVSSERIFAFAATYTWTEILGILRRLRPSNDKIPATPENEGHDLSKILPAKRAEQLLERFYGKGWTKLEDSIAAGIDGFE